MVRHDIEPVRGASCRVLLRRCSHYRFMAAWPPPSLGPILALQSDDHYVRVHGMAGSELLLIRLRDAIAEMEGIAGTQVHRSWWMAHEGVAAVNQAGRNWSIQLRNGVAVPVALNSSQRLRNSGILPANATVEGAA